MKKFLLPLLTILSVSLFAQSDNELLPYNPDYNGDGFIGSPDLLGFLPTYGEAFQPNGVLPVELGGTGETSIIDIRTTLNVMAFQDSTLNSGSLAGGIVNGTFTVTETFNHGEGNTVTGLYAQASGKNNLATGQYSFAANQNCKATNTCASAQNEGTTASGIASHAEGYTTVASGFSSHAEGYNCSASGYASHAQGSNSMATNNFTSACGNGVIADQASSTVVGKYNETNRIGTLFVVGSGESDATRTNAFEVSDEGALVNGNMEVTGELSINGDNVLQIIAAMQSQIDALQAELDMLSGGE